MNKAWFVIIGWCAIVGVLALMCLHARKRLAEIRCDPPDIVPVKPNKTFPKAMVQAAERIGEQELPPDNPPLVTGEECQLVGETGPVMLVVDTDGTHVIGSWDDGYQERKFPRTAVRRVRPKETAHAA